MKKAGFGIKDIGLIELNEAFAAQALACIKELNLDMDINVNGSGISLGHPIGCTGARITTTLYEMERRGVDYGYGLVSLCVGGGQGMAMIVERI